MTPEERLSAIAQKAEKSRARAQQHELRHSLALSRLQLMQARTVERRHVILGEMLVQAAATDAECWRVLGQFVRQIQDGKQSSLVDDWTVPQQPNAAVTTNKAATLF